MDQKKKRRTIALVIVGAMLVVSLIVGTSYAYWKITAEQNGTNELTTTCLNLTLDEVTTGITMGSQYPISDEEGMANEGYTFRVTNVCNTSVAFDINLESLDKTASENRLNLKYLDAVLGEGNIIDLDSYPQTETALKPGTVAAYDTRKLATGILGPNTSDYASEEYTLRVWLDKDASNEAMNKEWSGKISISATNTNASKATEKIIEIASKNTTELFTDNTADANIRYMGQDPKNYVYLGDGYYTTDIYAGYDKSGYSLYPVWYTSLSACEIGINDNYNTRCTKLHSKGDPILWRIIGVMNNVDDGTGQKETRLKVIREETLITTSYSEPCSVADFDANNGCSGTSYSNVWESSIANTLLNDAFYHSKISSPFIGQRTMGWDKKNEKRTADFSKVGLSSSPKELIGNAVYHLGGPFSDQFSTWTVADYYAGERNASQIRSGTSATWTGKLGLMYVSDVGFATVGGETKTKETCLTDPMENWRDLDDCTRYNWLTHYEIGKYDQWFMTPYPSDASSIISIRESGYLWGDWTHNGYALRPTAFLKADTRIMSGDGTKTNPYILGI